MGTTSSCGSPTSEVTTASFRAGSPPPRAAVICSAAVSGSRDRSARKAETLKGVATAVSEHKSRRRRRDSAGGRLRAQRILASTTSVDSGSRAFSRASRASLDPIFPSALAAAAASAGSPPLRMSPSAGTPAAILRTPTDSMSAILTLPFDVPRLERNTASTAAPGARSRADRAKSTCFGSVSIATRTGGIGWSPRAKLTAYRVPRFSQMACLPAKVVSARSSIPARSASMASRRARSAPASAMALRRDATASWLPAY